jgi:hypothetical protein
VVNGACNRIRIGTQRLLKISGRLVVELAVLSLVKRQSINGVLKSLRRNVETVSNQSNEVGCFAAVVALHLSNISCPAEDFARNSHHDQQRAEVETHGYRLIPGGLFEDHVELYSNVQTLPVAVSTMKVVCPAPGVVPLMI